MCDKKTNKLKLVGDGWHINLELSTQPYHFEDVLICHLNEQGQRALESVGQQVVRPHTNSPVLDTRTLVEKVRDAQVEAGEQAVMENLKRMGF